MTKICAIHQPNFFPWLGYFDKLKRADVFVFLDAVDYPKAGSKGMGSWCNRVMLNISGSAKWVGCNLEKFSGTLPINEVIISHNQPWQGKMLKSIEFNYKKAPNFDKAFPFLETLILNPESNLAEYNIHAITEICKLLKIETSTVRHSELQVTGQSTERLVNIVKAVDATGYLCGGGASGYQEDGLFEAAGIEVIYQNFKPEPYGDPSKYLPGLSVIDYLMHDISQNIWS